MSATGVISNWCHDFSHEQSYILELSMEKVIRNRKQIFRIYYTKESLTKQLLLFFFFLKK